VTEPEDPCRREEALSLRYGQIDWNSNEAVFSGNTKSGKARRVPLTDAAIAAIRAIPRSPASDYVFYHPETLTRWNDCRKPWEKAREEAGHPWLAVKDLRRAFAIKLAERGCPMHYIQEVLGHHSVTLTEKYYAKFSPASASRAVLRILQGGRDGEALGEWHKTGTEDR
jgi:integrase